MNNGVTSNGELVVGLWTDMMAMRTRGYARGLTCLTVLDVSGA
jgi:hypothetical protein